MREFIHGWRRKLGLLTLLAACVFACGWVRSRTFIDTVEFHSNDKTIQSFISVGGSVVWWTSGRKSWRQVDLWSSVEYTELGSSYVNDQDSWLSYLLGFAYDFQDLDDSKWTQRRMIPYWFIVIPLTSLSASLLISKPGTLRKFFKPTRRKLGFLLLLMACLTCAAWVRSCYFFEDICVHSYHLRSACSKLVLINFQDWVEWQQATHVAMEFWDTSDADNRGWSSFLSEGTEERGVCGFHCGTQETSYGPTLSYWAVPYWFIVLSQILLSACLLLSKPRPAKRSS